MDLPGKTALITGGASGIGAALARLCAEGGARVVICDWNSDGARSLAADLGPSAHALPCDVSEVMAVKAMVAAAADWLGGLDLVFANAGIGAGAPILKASEDEFDVTFGVNVKGVWAVCAEAARWMVAHDKPGHLCMTGSEHSLGFQHAGNALYTASKHAVLGLADVMRHELPDTIGVSVLCPGLTATGMPENRAYSPLGPDAPQREAFGKAIMAEGTAPDIVAQKTLDGIARGDFLIVTHAVAKLGAERRWHEVNAAFEAQAPMTEEAAKLEVNAVIARLLKERA